MRLTLGDETKQSLSKIISYTFIFVLLLSNIILNINIWIKMGSCEKVLLCNKENILVHNKFVMENLSDKIKKYIEVEEKNLIDKQEKDGIIERE